MKLPPQSVFAIGPSGALVRPWYIALSSIAGAPRAAHPFVEANRLLTPEWHRILVGVGMPASDLPAVAKDRRMTIPWYLYLSKL